MSRTLTPRAQEILCQAAVVLAKAGMSLKHVTDIANAGAILRTTVVEPGQEWHNIEPDLSDLIADAFDYIGD